jgi:hypothetical protein
MAYQCAACGECFRTDGAFQAHRAGRWADRRCVAPGESKRGFGRRPRFPSRLTLASALSYLRRAYDHEPQPVAHLQQGIEFLAALGWSCVWTGDSYALQCRRCGKIYVRPLRAARHHCSPAVDLSEAA